jgi:hypothetical protein
MEDSSKKAEVSAAEDGVKDASSKEVLDLLRMAECCVVVMDGQFTGLDTVGRSRLARNLLNLVLLQVAIRLRTTVFMI